MNEFFSKRDLNRWPNYPSVSGLNNVSSHSLQWNSHGYDVAKTFGPKLTSVSPVWLQLRRRGPETFDVTGIHDHDPGRGP